MGNIKNLGEWAKKGAIPWNKDKHKMFICAECNKEFYPEHDGAKRTFCSKTCFTKGFPKILSRTHTGLKLSEEHKKNIGLASKGKIRVPKFDCKNCGVQLSTRKNKTRLCIHCAGEIRRGENHYAWNGGINKTERQVAMQRKEYILWRKAVFERDDFTCQMCLTRGGYLEADHIKSWAQYPDLRYAIDNGRTLCSNCHKTTFTWGFKGVPRAERMVS